MEPVNLTGISGRQYPFIIGDLFAPWNEVAGLYAFVSWTVSRFNVLYIGECENFVTRPMPPGHERWTEALRTYNATHVLARTVVGFDEARKTEERDLIAAYNPPMNRQHRTGLAGLAAAPSGVGLFGLAQAGRRGILSGGR